LPGVAFVNAVTGNSFPPDEDGPSIKRGDTQGSEMKTNQKKIGTVLASLMLVATLTACAVARDSNLAATAPPVVQAYSHDVYFY